MKLSPFKRVLKSLSIVAFGIVTILFGFIYDALYAGIPYQDPTPQLQAQFDYHKSIADIFYHTGGLVFLVGLVAAPIIWLKTRGQ